MTIAIALQESAALVVSIGATDTFGIQLAPYADGTDAISFLLNDVANLVKTGDVAIDIGTTDNPISIRFTETASLLYGIPGTDTFTPRLTDVGTVTRVVDTTDTFAVSMANVNDVVLSVSGATGDVTGFTQYKVSMTALFGGPAPAAVFVAFGDLEHTFSAVPAGRYTARWELSNNDGSVLGTGVTIGPFSVGNFAEVAVTLAPADTLAIRLSDPTPDIQISSILINKGVSDDFTGIVTDTVAVLVIPPTGTDTLGVALSDLGNVFTDVAEKAATDTLSAVLSDAATLFAVVIVNVTDTLAAALSEAGTTLVVFDSIVGTDTLAAAVSETTALLSRLDPTDTVRVVLSEVKSLAVVTENPKHGDVIDTTIEVLGLPHTIEVL